MGSRHIIIPRNTRVPPRASQPPVLKMNSRHIIQFLKNLQGLSIFLKMAAVTSYRVLRNMTRGKAHLHAHGHGELHRDVAQAAGRAKDGDPLAGLHLH